MAQSVLKRNTGVIVGDDVLALFNYAQEKKFAIPAIVRGFPVFAIVSVFGVVCFWAEGFGFWPFWSFKVGKFANNGIRRT